MPELTDTDRAAQRAALAATADWSARNAMDRVPLGAAWGAVVLVMGVDAAGVGYAGEETLAAFVPERLRAVAASFEKRPEVGAAIPTPPLFGALPMPPAENADAPPLERAALEALVALDVLISAFGATRYITKDADMRARATELLRVCQRDADALRQALTSKGST